MSETRYKFNVARGLAVADGPAVDRLNGIIRGYAVVTKGPVEGHEIEFDDAALDKIVELGSASKVGIHSRFGHPGASVKAEGSELGRAKNFRREGDVVRADLHLFDAARRAPKFGDLRNWVLDMAEEAPDAFGSSMVITGDEEWRLDENDEPLVGEDGKPLFPVFRPTKLLYSDIVSEPAANTGLFSRDSLAFFTADLELSARAEEFLDRFLGQPEAVDSVVGFLQRYSANHQHALSIRGAPSAGPPAKAIEADNPSGAKERKDPMADSNVASPVAAETKTQPSQLDAASVAKEAREAERARVKALREAAFDGQEELLDKAIDEGWSLEQAVLAFNKDMRDRLGSRRAGLEADPAKGLGPTVQRTPKLELGAPIVAGEVKEDAAKARWEEMSRSERQEYFGDFDNYKAHLQSVATGSARGSLAAVE